jgi:hypothetical protein
MPGVRFVLNSMYTVLTCNKEKEKSNRHNTIKSELNCKGILYGGEVMSDINIYVSTLGCDVNGNGTMDYPYASIKKAQLKVREILKSGCKDKIIVNVEKGKYFFESPVIFTKEDSGCYGKPVIYRANKKSDFDVVEISGAITLNIDNWEEYNKNSTIKVAQLEKNLKIDMLFVNKKLQTLARYPNLIEERIPLGSVATVEQIKERVKNYFKVEGGYIRALHKYKWGGNSYIITGKDYESPIGLKLKWIGDNNRGSDYHTEAVVIENIFEELDSPNEWYYDKESGKLYYYPENDTDILNSVVEASVSSELFKFVGIRDGEKVNNIVLDGFDFTGTKRSMFTIEEQGKQYVPLLRGDWCIVRAGAIYIQDAENITIKNSRFYNIGGNGVFISGYNKEHIIDNNEFINFGSTCVQVIGLPEAVYEPSFWAHDYYKNFKDFVVHKTKVEFPDKTGPKTEDYPRDIIISKNHMYNIGIFEKQSSGINLSISRGIKILSNTIHRSSRSCINVNDGTFGGHEIAYNDIFDSQRETVDHGPFNSWGRDRFWSVPCYNASGLYGDIAKPYAFLDAIETISIHNNKFHHLPTAPHTWGIDLDDGSSNYEIFNNLCLGLGIKLREGYDRKVYNNIIIDGQIHIHCTYKEANDSIYSNLILNSKPFAYPFAGQGGKDEERIYEGNYKIDRNWYYNFGNKINLPAFWENSGYDANSLLNENPIFKEPQINDYTVTNTEAVSKIGFKTFAMNNFGKPNCKYQSPIYIANASSSRIIGNLQAEVWKGAIISNIDESIMSSTASNGLKGVYFRNVPENSEAYELGFRPNDILKVFNGIQLDGVAEYKLQCSKFSEEESICCSIHRLGNQQEIYINNSTFAHNNK